jgi:hypothetical protein
LDERAELSKIRRGRTLFRVRQWTVPAVQIFARWIDALIVQYKSPLISERLQPHVAQVALDRPAVRKPMCTSCCALLLSCTLRGAAEVLLHDALGLGIARNAMGN